MLALAVLLSIAGLAAGPALVAVGRGRALPSAAVEGLTLGVVPALIVLRLLPHLYAGLGPLALVLASAGYVLLWQMDQQRHGAGERFGHALVVPALAAHALTDGAGLAISVAGLQRGTASAGVLAAAIVLHRLPEGLFLATELVPELGWRRTLNRLGLLAGCTLLGAAVGSSLLEHVSDAVFDGAVAVGLGVILRLVVHSHAPVARSGVARAVGGAMFIAGVVVAVAIPAPDSVLQWAQPREVPVVRSLLPLFVATAPAMLLGLLGAGLVTTLWPPRQGPVAAIPVAGASAWRSAWRGILQAPALRSDGDGLLRSVRARLAAGESAATPLALAASASELSLDAAALSLRLLGPLFALLRIATSALMAVVLAVATARARDSDAAGEAPSTVTSLVPPAMDPVVVRGPWGAMRGALGLAFGPLLDRVAAWYLGGLVAAATLEAAVRHDVLAQLGTPLDVLLGVLLAVPLYVGAPGATPLAAMLVHKGLSPGAALAFVLVGPGTNPGLLRVVRAALGARAMLVLAAGAVALAFGAGVAANGLIAPGALPGLHPLVQRRVPGAEWACAAALAVALAASLLRLGPRTWFGHMAPGGHDPSAHH